MRSLCSRLIAFMAVSLLLFWIRLLFDDGGNAQPARRADRTPAAPAATLVDRLGQRCQLPAPGGGEGMPAAQGAAVDVHLGAVDGAQRCVQPQPFATVVG